MFLPEELLYKQGALAHVWLASNQQRKLTKAQVLQHKIPETCEVIIRPEVAAGGPLALRLNAQLLLGEVRIYHKKAHYLQDDCNEALWKIKMAFRPGNIDLPAQTHVANPTNLILPDQITDLDLLAPMPDPSFLLSQPLGSNLDLENITVPDWDNSQFLSGSIEQPRREPMDIGDDGLGLDIGEYDDPPLPFDDGPSIEVGRNAPLERRESEDFTSLDKNLMEMDDDLGLDIGEDQPTEMGAPDLNMDDDVDITMGGMTEMDLPTGSIAGDLPVRQREESPLSELGEEEATRLEQEVAEQNATMFEPGQEQEEDESVHQARAKRRRVIAQDAETMISSHQLREQQNNREKILKPASFLPRDPLLMALINMQKSGGFVSSILGDGRSQGWAPQLRGILSLEVISRPAQKRKRDSGVADLGTTEDEAAAEGEKTPQLEFEQDEPSLGGADFGVGGDNTTLGGSDDIIQLPDEPGFHQIGEDNDAFSPIPDNFDDTTAPLVHPDEAGPISLGTKHAVHLLREHFGPEGEESESQRQKSSIVFQDVFPELRTSRADATKMFFEMLVLATKDAIKVEQPANELGGPLRIRAKRGLWGQWAETGASGELASQAQVAPVGDVDAPAEAIFQGPSEVSVSA
ncbi:double-strand-break repair protein-like protein rad21 [Clathrospora elynae]|uniref:Double-strand-break repair protein-like protein rad21 n=1 Tax=Clathrospora elynae TaxID=706981 RepID=A0A6A5SR02_9PLEO|nr:double-strand-break repair protein-like protein rad21 [Clathrospora elynae]